MSNAIHAVTVEPVRPGSLTTRPAVVGGFIGMPTTGIRNPDRWRALETDQQLFSLDQQCLGTFHGEPVKAYAEFQGFDGFHDRQT